MRTEIVSTRQDRQWQGIPAIERAPNGRLWCAFFSGGPKEPDPANRLLLTTSGDDGATWSGPDPIIDPPGMTRAFDPALWHDPDGRLWMFYNLANLETRTFDLWAMTTDEPDVEGPRWDAPRRIGIDAPFAFRLNKPTVLTSGEWLLPVTWARTKPDGWFAGDGQVQGVAISADAGLTWALHGAVEAPHWALENMIVERADGSLWMLMRTGAGVLWQSVSNDRGRTWGPGAATDIVNPGVRFFIRRLESGPLLLINTPNPKRRQGLYAYVSAPDDDTVFGPGLLLDDRDNVSYPDAIETPGGVIYAVHDHERHGAAEIVLDVFPVADIPAP